MQEKLIAQLSYKDAQLVMHHGYLAFFKSHNWPFRKSGSKIQVYDMKWYDVTVEEVESFLNRIFKKIEGLFTSFVALNHWLTYDPDGKYPKYSLHIYGKKSIPKIKSLLYKKNTVD
jgi:hypothetical protein